MEVKHDENSKFSMEKGKLVEVRVRTATITMTKEDLENRIKELQDAIRETKNTMKMDKNMIKRKKDAIAESKDKMELLKRQLPKFG